MQWNDNLFEELEHVQPFAAYMNKQHPNITFSKEVEKELVSLFLDIKIYKKNGKFVTSVYREGTFKC